VVTAYFAGFALGLSLILAIGAQNAFVLRQGLREEHVLPVVLACAISDAILVSVGVFAFAAIAKVLPGIAPFMRWGGAVFLIAYGALAFRAALRSSDVLQATEAKSSPLAATVLTVLALTWLNPHVYLDTVVLLGSVSTQYGENRLGFAMGAVTSSFVFFFSLGYGARFLRPLFAKPMAWRVLEGVIGVTMWAIAASLIFGH